MTGGISEVYGKLDGMGLAALVKKGEVSPSEVLEEAIRRAEAVNGTLNFLTYKAYEEGRKMAADPCTPRRPLPRRALAGEGDRNRLGGAAEHQRLPLLQGHRLDERQRAGEARQAGGLRAARQVELAGGRLGALHRAQDVWPDRQSLGYDAHTGRLLRRLGCGCGGPRAAAGRSERRRRLHPHAGVPLRPRRPQARARAHHDGAGCGLLVRRRDLPLRLAQRARYGRLFRCRRRPHAGRSLLRGHAGHPLPR